MTIVRAVGTAAAAPARHAVDIPLTMDDAPRVEATQGWVMPEGDCYLVARLSIPREHQTSRLELTLPNILRDGHIISRLASDVIHVFSAALSLRLLLIRKRLQTPLPPFLRVDNAGASVFLRSGLDCRSAVNSSWSYSLRLRLGKVDHGLVRSERKRALSIARRRGPTDGICGFGRLVPLSLFSLFLVKRRSLPARRQQRGFPRIRIGGEAGRVHA